MKETKNGKKKKNEGVTIRRKGGEEPKPVKSTKKKDLEKDAFDLE